MINSRKNFKPVPKSRGSQTSESVFSEKIELFFIEHDRKVFFILLSVSLLFSVLLFNARMSVFGDDAAYIERAWDFLHESKFPYFQGPGYPLFLSVFVKMFGLNIILLKLSSLICHLFFVVFTYKAFHRRVPFTVLFILLTFICVNNFFLYYASQTYTESFFMAVQAFCIYITFITVDAGKDISGWKQEMRGNSMNWILFGLSFLILYISKTVAFIALPAIAMALVLMKNYRQAVFAILYFAFFLIIYMIISGLIYGPPDVSQMEMMLRKDLYHPELGHENVSGLTDRFFSNLVTYIGVHAFRILNFKTSDMDAFEVNIFFLILSVAFFLYAILRSKKSNGYIFITSLYAIAMCVVIFFGVHASNTQDRLIIIVMPLIFLVSTYVIYETIKKNYFTGILFTLFISVMFFVTTGRTVLAIEKNLPALKKNIEGDIYYGYNPDWTNFLKISRYCADSLPEDAVVLSRKPGNSFIYGRGKKFEGQYMVTARDPDSVLTEFRRRKIQYFILARIRYNPEVNDGRFISTIHTMTEPISVKYPEKIKIVKVIGDDEFAALCEIKY